MTRLLSLISGIVAFLLLGSNGFAPSMVRRFCRAEVPSATHRPSNTPVRMSGVIEFVLDGTEQQRTGNDMLESAIGCDGSAASELLSEISKWRETGTLETNLRQLLSNGPDAPLPFWARSKRLARFSRRARMASLRRTLDLTTPPPSSSDTQEEGDSPERNQKRRQRALGALLRSLASAEDEFYSTSTPAIVVLERKAKEKENADDLRTRLPEGLETPNYDILAERQQGSRRVEIRNYKPYAVCAVSMNQPRPKTSSETDAKVQMPELGGASSFGALAGYLFGKNQESTAMKMTTPVFFSPTPDDSDRQMEFVLPSQFWEEGTFEMAPKPLSGSGVTLQQKESVTRAVLMFGGYASKKEVEKQKKELKKILSKDAEWQIAEDDATLAQYNDPFTLPWRRLNEVSIKVEPKPQTS